MCGLKLQSKLKYHQRQLALASLLLIVSFLSLQPGLTLAAQTNGTIKIEASGIAMPIGHGNTAAGASLSLTGNVQSVGNDPLKLGDLSGNLQIGSNNYAVTDGHGEINDKGMVQINGVASNGGSHELILHGTMQENSIVFDSHESKLASMYFLSLSGEADLSGVSLPSGSTETSSSVETSETSASSTNSTATTTQSTDSTNSEPGGLQNVTVTETVTQNQTVTETIGGNGTITVTAPSNQTVTTTETTTVANQTVTETTTQTVANTTITETQTTTVANVTITETVIVSVSGNVTITITPTVTNSTVTNSTQTTTGT